MNPTPDLVSLLDATYVDERAKEKLDFPIRGSAVGRCPRELAALLLVTDRKSLRPYSMRSLRSFEMGNDREERLFTRLETALKAQGYVVHRQFEVWTTIPGIVGADAKDIAWKAAGEFGGEPSLRHHTDKDGALTLRVRSRCDLVAVSSLGPSHVLNIDCKTKASYGFKKLEAEGNDDGYMVQLACQTTGLVEAGCSDVRSMCLYEDKNTGDLLTVPMEDHAFARLGTAMECIVRMLRGWLAGESVQIMGDALFAELRNWNKKSHVAALGCLPWQCNYCKVGPVLGMCMSDDVRVEDIRKPGTDIPKWEVLKR